MYYLETQTEERQTYEQSDKKRKIENDVEKETEKIRNINQRQRNNKETEQKGKGNTMN